MPYLFLLGRVLFGGFFFFAGLRHFTKHKDMTGYAQSKGVPMASAAVALSGLLILLGGLGILLGVYIQWSVLFIVIFLVIVTFTMHAYWNDKDPMMAMSNRVNFEKNLALLGAALMLLSIATPWMWSAF